jgi:DNA polymerase-3 subunit delta'
MTAGSRPIGHADVVARLEAAAEAVAEGRPHPLAHALVFVGPPGVGKYTTALWWAARLKCGAQPPCSDGACRDCRQVRAGTHPDVTLLVPAEPGASIPIEAVRGLIHAMSLRPVRPGPRIAVVRDAQALTPHAQSAMLKLLEEPPGFAVLVLVTDNASAMLPTIRSRCQMLRFGALDPAEIRIVLESHGWDAEAAARAADAARGSAGRALERTPEWIEDRDTLTGAVQALGARERNDLEVLVADLVERRKAGRPAVETLLEWQLGNVEASIAQAGDGGDPAALLRDAERTAWALGALDRNGNPKLVLRELLLGVRDK